MASESDAVIGKLQKDFGAKVGGRGMVIVEAPRISTGIFPFDLATGGGFPRGRASILYGKESSGKSLLAYKAIRTVQQQGETAALVETEHVYDSVWGARVGIDTNKLILIRPDNAEQAVDATEALLYAKDVGIVVLDSLANLVTENEIVSDAGKVIVAGASIMVGKLFRKGGVALSREEKRGHTPVLLLINQIRMKVGVMFGDPEIMPGGHSPNFNSSLTVRLYSKPKDIKGSDSKLSELREVSGTIRKNRVPIVASSFQYDLPVTEQHGRLAGEVDAWNTVAAYLKSHNLLTKALKGGGWDCLGQSFKLQDQVHDLYWSDPAFARLCEAAVVSAALKKPLVDPSTGEIL